MKKLLLFFVFLVLLCFVSAYDLGVYPDEMNFDAEIGERVCKKAIIFSSENTSVEIEDYWSYQGERKVEEYYQKSEMKGIEISYPEKLIFKGKKEVKICITGNIAGRFNGLLMIRGENAGIGSWINVNIRNNFLSGITGRAVYDLEEGETMGFMLFFTFVLILILGYLVFKRKRYPN